MVINGDDVGVWTNNDDVDETVGIFMRLVEGVNSTDADLLFVINDEKFSIIAVWWYCWWWFKLDDDEGVSRLTKYSNKHEIYVY